MGTNSGIPPVSDTLNSCEYLVVNTDRCDVNRTPVPSVVNACTKSAPGCQVRRVGTPPVAGITNTSLPP